MASIRKAEEKKLSLTIFLQFAACDVWIVWSLDHRKEGRDWEGSNKEFSSRPKMPLLVLFSHKVLIAQNPFYAITADCRNSLLFLLPFSLPSTSYIYLPPRPNQTIPDLKFGAKIYGGKLGVENWGQKI